MFLTNIALNSVLSMMFLCCFSTEKENRKHTYRHKTLTSIDQSSSSSAPNRLFRSRSPQPILRIEIHRINPLIRRIPILPHPQRNQSFIRRQQRSRKRIPPINTQPRTGNLHPTFDVGHGSQLPGKDLAEQQIDDGNTAVTEMVLDHGHGVRVPLSTKRAEYDAPFAG